MAFGVIQQAELGLSAGGGQGIPLNAYKIAGSAIAGLSGIAVGSGQEGVGSAGRVNNPGAFGRRQ